MMDATAGNVMLEWRGVAHSEAVKAFCGEFESVWTVSSATKGVLRQARLEKSRSHSRAGRRLERALGSIPSQPPARGRCALRTQVHSAGPVQSHCRATQGQRGPTNVREPQCDQSSPPDRELHLQTRQVCRKSLPQPLQSLK